jgi:hypothetical protein
MSAEEEKTAAVLQRDNICENSNTSDSSTTGLKKIHFECSKCRRTVMNCNEDQAAKNMCKGCLAAMEFSASVVEGVGGGPPLVSSNNSVTSNNSGHQLVSSSPAISISRNDDGNFDDASSVLTSSPNLMFTGLRDDGVYNVGETHIIATQMKAPNRTSNYSIMNLYESEYIYDRDLEVRIRGDNEKKVNKFYMGVDVIFKANGKVFTSYPLLCPASIHYILNGEESRDIIVGIITDNKGGVFPVLAVYDLMGTFKNVAKSKTIIHTYFQRVGPHDVKHDLDDTERDRFSLAISELFNVKDPMHEMEGII